MDKLLKKASDQGSLREMIGFVAQSMMGLEMAGLIHAWGTDLGIFQDGASARIPDHRWQQ